MIHQPDSEKWRVGTAQLFVNQSVQRKRKNSPLSSSPKTTVWKQKQGTIGGFKVQCKSLCSSKYLSVGVTCMQSLQLDLQEISWRSSCKNLQVTFASSSPTCKGLQNIVSFIHQGRVPPVEPKTCRPHLVAQPPKTAPTEQPPDPPKDYKSLHTFQILAVLWLSLHPPFLRETG